MSEITRRIRRIACEIRKGIATSLGQMKKGRIRIGDV